MQVTKISETVFGSKVEGIQIQLTLSEASAVKKMLGQGISHPPMADAINTDYNAKEIGATLSSQIGALLNGR